MPDDNDDEAWIKACAGASAPQQHHHAGAEATAPSVEAVAAQHHLNNLPPAILHGVFGHLGPRDLCAVSATCQLWRTLNQDKAAREQWKQFYTSRWRVLGPGNEDVCWQTKYGSKMKQVREERCCWGDSLHVTRNLAHHHHQYRRQLATLASGWLGGIPRQQQLWHRRQKSAHIDALLLHLTRSAQTGCCL